MKNRVYFIIVFIFFSCVSYSANVEWMKGYVVTNESDTIYGELGYRDGTGDWKECFYRQQGEVEYKVYSPEQITAYGYESGLLFVSEDIKLFKIKQRVFVQSLLSGIIDLYYLDVKKCTDFPKGYAAYIVKEASGIMMELSDPSKSDNRDIIRRQNKAKLNYLFSDYPQLQESINKIDSDRDQWIALFQKYHDIICNESVCTNYEEKKVASRCFLTPYIIGNYCKVGFNNFVDRNSFAPGIGVAFSRSMSKYTDRNLIHVGLEFSGISISSHEEGSEQMDFSTLSFINYYTYENRFTLDKVAPLLEVGFFHGLQFACKNKLESHYDYANEGDYNKYYYGITLGAGIAIKVRKTWIPVKLQYRYYFWGTKVLEGVSLQKINGVSLSIGYDFKL